MRTIVLEHETDFDGWRQAARALALDGIKPADVTWMVRSREQELFTPAETKQPARPSSEAFKVPAGFLDLAGTAILHRDRERFAILYRLLWRLRQQQDLLEVMTDADVIGVSAMAKAVRRDEHKMHAFVRFREIARDQETRFVAWFEPEHHIVELAAPFF